MINMFVCEQTDPIISLPTMNLRWTENVDTTRLSLPADTI